MTALSMGTWAAYRVALRPIDSRGILAIGSVVIGMAAFGLVAALGAGLSAVFTGYPNFFNMGF